MGISYRENVERAISVIRKTLDDTPLVLVEPEPSVYVDSLGESSVRVNVWCWAPFSEWFSVRSLLVQKIKQEFDSNKIEMPPPSQLS